MDSTAVEVLALKFEVADALVWFNEMDVSSTTLLAAASVLLAEAPDVDASVDDVPMLSLVATGTDVVASCGTVSFAV